VEDTVKHPFYGFPNPNTKNGQGVTREFRANERCDSVFDMAE
jgi:hypothetical protein